MNGQRKTRTKVIGLGLAVVLGASAGALVAGVLPPQPQAAERGAQAWTARLVGQADAYREARAANAYTLRLLGIHRALVNGAWTDRLNAQVEALGPGGMNTRTAQAWTDRLDGLADVQAAR